MWGVLKNLQDELVGEANGHSWRSSMLRQEDGLLIPFETVLVLGLGRVPKNEYTCDGKTRNGRRDTVASSTRRHDNRKTRSFKVPLFWAIIFPLSYFWPRKRLSRLLNKKNNSSFKTPL
jgi:hypothetical protein